MKNELVVLKLNEILSRYKEIEYQNSKLYLLDKKGLDEVLLLENSLRGEMIEKAKPDEKIKDPFYAYGKIINPKFPAFKYSLYLNHKKKEIFDRSKIKDTIPKEISIWINTERKHLEERIRESDPPMSSDTANKLRKELEETISIEEQNIEKILNDFESYDVVITSFEQYTYYPGLYGMVNLNHGKNKDDAEWVEPGHKKFNTHLRQDVPNILWYLDDRPFNELRTNDKIGRIIQTHTPHCGTIYVKKYDENERDQN